MANYTTLTDAQVLDKITKTQSTKGSVPLKLAMEALKRGLQIKFKK